MWRLALALLAGCTYRSPGTVEEQFDAAPQPSDDAPTGSEGVTACTVAAAGSETATAGIGGTGGSDQTPATCAAGELPIGIAYDVSQNVIASHASQVAMVNLHVRCGRVERGTDGVFRATAAELFDSTGGVGGNCSAYFPTVATAETRCPTGSVLVGVDGNRLDTTLYNTVVLVCAALDAGGVPVATTQLVPITGTGGNSNQPMQATCGAGQAVTSFAIRSACGHDQLVPRCAPLACN